MRKGCKLGCACMGAFLGCMLLLAVGLYVYAEWIWEEWSSERIERITGVKVPEFAIVERHDSERHFTGDYLDTLTIEFEYIPSDALFDEIDKKIQSGNTGWQKDGNKYLFLYFGGMVILRPKVNMKKMMAYLA